MPEYSSPDDYADFDPTFTVPDDTTELEAVLTVAERDIEYAIGVYGRSSTGSKIDVDGLDEWRSTCLIRAVCAQAQYHMFKGEEFFASGRPTAQSSREGSIASQEPYIGPKASTELSRGGFYRLTTGHGRLNPYALPNQNIDD
jgi:hypothetical protein